MFEKEIKFIGDFCFNQVRSLGSNFTLDKIANAGVHPAIVQYISAELDFMIYSDRRKLLQQSYFDYAGKEILEHFQKISGEIRKHKKISLDDSKKLIFQAVSFNINYLVRPRWSLMKLIFNDQPVIPVEEMRMLLNYLYYYEYFKKVLNGYISKRNLVQISSTEFDILLNKIDNELLNSDQHQVISNSFTSMGDFFNIGGVDKNRIPITAVEIFCKEKNLVDLIVRLKKAIPNEVKRRYDKVEIERILFSPDAKKIMDEELEPEDDDAKTEKMIEALDADEVADEIENNIENEFEDLDNTIADETEKEDAESFLSPEEEEALLSLYSEDNEKESEAEHKPETLSGDEVSQEINEQVAEGVKTDLDLEKPVYSQQEEIEEETEVLETFNDIEESSATETTEEESSDNLINSEEELEGIVDAISDNLSEEEIDIDEENISDGLETLESETESEPENIEDDVIESEVENEIVQEMMSDYYNEDNPEESAEEEDEILEAEMSLPEIDESNQPETEESSLPQTETVEEEAEEKIASLEDDLLNIFEGLDKEEFKFPEKDRFSVNENENPLEEVEEEKNTKETFSSETTDGFDEYLKSIDEIIFTDNVEKTTEEPVQFKSEEKIETQVQTNEKTEALKKDEEVGELEKVEELKEVEKVEEVFEHPTSTSQKIKKEKPSNTRTLRPKDLFKYLKRKEVKKIVSYIFANDEEDFTNTVERIMDCHSYKEASDILKAVFTSYKISPYSKEAITFTNAVSNYFRQA